MSDENYSRPPHYYGGRHHSGPFFDPPEEDYDEPRPREGGSFNEDPLRHPLNVENLRRLWRERNPHDD